MGTETRTIPAVDLTPTGHALPFLATDGAREHDDAEHSPAETGRIDLDKVIAATPDAVRVALQKACPDQYTPELAAQIAADVIAQLDAMRAPARPLTAAQRGHAWMARWGCPGFCVEEHGRPGAMECHSTTPVETRLLAADLDSSGYSTNAEELPWMTAQVVVNNDKAQAYGRHTRVWLGYGVHLAEISPAKAREALDVLRAFTTRLAAVVDLAEQVAADDFAGDPEIAAADREAEDRRIRAITEASARGDLR